MKRWRLFVLIAVGITIIVLIYLYRQELGITGPSNASGDQSSSSSSEQSGSIPHPARIVWQKLDRTPDGFKVEMPTDVKEIQIPAYNERGGSDQVEMIYSYPDAETSYSLAWADNPPVARATGMSADRTLDAARDDALLRTQTTLIAESRSNRQGFPARDFAGRNSGGGIFNARLILAGSRLYMLIASYPSAGARREQDVARFFNSFTIIANTRTQ